MKTLFPLALLCLLFSSCYKEVLIDDESLVTETRIASNISVTYTLLNGSASTVECLRVVSSVVNANAFSAKIYTSPSSYYTVSVQSLLISGINNTLKCTNGSGDIYNNLIGVKILPFSTTQVKSLIGDNNVIYSNSFIGEESDGF